MDGDSPCRRARTADDARKHCGHVLTVTCARVTTARSLRRVRRALRLLSDPKQVRSRLAIAGDARRFHEATGFFRGRPVPSGPVALGVSLSDWPYQLKLEGMLLEALELEGLRPLVLTGAAERCSAGRYHDAFGLDAVVLDDFAEPNLARGLRAEADVLLAEGATLRQLRDLRYRGVHVGQHVLSTVSRRMFDGSVSLSDPVAQALVRRLLPDAMELTLLAERMLDRLQPEVLLFNEARYAGYGPIFEAALARGVDVIQFVHGYSADALVFKRYTAETSRVHPRSVGDAAWGDVKAGSWTQSMEQELTAQFDVRYGAVDLLSRRLHEGTRRRGGAVLAAELGLDVDKPNAVLFSHVLWDANLFYGDDLFEDQEEWLIETIRAAVANPRVNWVVKLHPANIWKRRLEGQTGELPELAAIRAKVGALPRHVKLLLPDTDVSTLSLFELADYALTIRGTIGMEAPVFGVPVVTGGTSHYSGRGFTLDSATADDYRQLLSLLHERPSLLDEQVLLAKKHAHAVFVRRPLHFTSFRSVIEPVEGRGGPLSHNLELTISSRKELESALDLREFARWAVDRESEDYLAPLHDPVVDESPVPIPPHDGAGAMEQAQRTQR